MNTKALRTSQIHLIVLYAKPCFHSSRSSSVALAAFSLKSCSSFLFFTTTRSWLKLEARVCLVTSPSGDLQGHSHNDPLQQVFIPGLHGAVSAL